jgi:hypothetical protein
MLRFLLALYMAAYIWLQGDALKALASDLSSGLVSWDHLKAGIGLILIAFACSVATDRLSKSAKTLLTFLAPILAIALMMVVG